jgi:exopolyphosphatase/pppGpp-phosphohydrolase
VWKAARAATASLGAGTLSQYSIAGRTFTKRTLKELQDFARSELQEVLGILGIAGGGSALIDLSGGRAYGVGT